jgi:hypothetical protein
MPRPVFAAAPVPPPIQVKPAPAKLPPTFTGVLGAPAARATPAPGGEWKEF